MTDKERLIELLTSFGIPFRKEPFTIECKTDAGGDKITGYSGFYTEFMFDVDGKFEKMGIWE